MRNLILTIALLLAVPVFGEEPTDLTQTIRGTVTDKVTGSPLIGATVIISNTKPVVGTITDINGIFRFEEVPVGRQAIEISYVGYHPLVIPNLLLTTGKEVVVTASLEEKAFQVEELTIRPDRKKEKARNEMASVSARMFSVEETERFAGSLGDPARMVANYAGVMTQNDSRNDIIIRGNSPAGLLWRLEGVEIPNPNHFGALGTTGGPVSMVNNNLLTDSDFLTGAFPAEFGNATAGAFDLNLRSGNNQKLEFTGQVGFNGFEAGIEGPVKLKENGPHPSFLANYRYSTLQLMHEIGFGTGTGSAIPEYNDLTFLVDIPATAAGRFKIFGLRGKSYIALGHDATDTTDNSYNARGTTTDFGSSLAVIGLSHNYYLNENTSIKSTVSYQKTGAQTLIDSLKEESAVMPYYRSFQDEEKLSLSTRLKKKLNSRNNFSLGFVADVYQVSFADSVHDTDLDLYRVLADAEGSLTVLRSFVQYQYKLKNDVTMNAGLHFQYSDISGDLVAEPRLGMRIPAGYNSSFNLGFGMHSQLQPKNVYFDQTLDEKTGIYSKSNSDIGFTRSNHYIAGYDRLLAPNFRFKLETYYQSIYNVPVKESFPEFSMINAGDQFGMPREDDLINEGKGRNYGLELTLEKFLSDGYYVLLTASLFESEYAGYDGIWRNTAFNGNYVLNLLGGYEFRLGEKTMLTFDLKSVLAGGKRYIPIDLEASIEQNTEVRDWGRAYEEKYDPYFRTDIRLGIKKNGKRISQEWGIDLQNIANYRSIFMEGYDTSKQDVYQVYQQGFAPMALYRLQF